MRWTIATTSRRRHAHPWTPERFVESFAMMMTGRIVTGQPGSGKTTHMVRDALRHARDGAPHRRPVLVVGPASMVGSIVQCLRAVSSDVTVLSYTATVLRHTHRPVWTSGTNANDLDVACAAGPVVVVTSYSLFSGAQTDTVDVFLYRADKQTIRAWEWMGLDECHHAGATKRKAALDRLHVVNGSTGYSATPARHDHAALPQGLVLDRTVHLDVATTASPTTTRTVHIHGVAMVRETTALALVRRVERTLTPNLATAVWCFGDKRLATVAARTWGAMLLTSDQCSGAKGLALVQRVFEEGYPVGHGRTAPLLVLADELRESVAIPGLEHVVGVMTGGGRPLPWYVQLAGRGAHHRPTMTVRSPVANATFIHVGARAIARWEQTIRPALVAQGLMGSQAVHLRTLFTAPFQYAWHEPPRPLKTLVPGGPWKVTRVWRRRHDRLVKVVGRAPWTAFVEAGMHVDVNGLRATVATSQDVGRARHVMAVVRDARRVFPPLLRALPNGPEETSSSPSSSMFAPYGPLRSWRTHAHAVARTLDALPVSALVDAVDATARAVEIHGRARHENVHVNRFLTAVLTVRHGPHASAFTTTTTTDDIDDENGPANPTSTAVWVTVVHDGPLPWSRRVPTVTVAIHGAPVTVRNAMAHVRPTTNPVRDVDRTARAKASLFVHVPSAQRHQLALHRRALDASMRAVLVDAVSQFLPWAETCAVNAIAHGRAGTVSSTARDRLRRRRLVSCHGDTTQWKINERQLEPWCDELRRRVGTDARTYLDAVRAYIQWARHRRRCDAIRSAHDHDGP